MQGASTASGGTVAYDGAASTVDIKQKSAAVRYLDICRCLSTGKLVPPVVNPVVVELSSTDFWLGSLAGQLNLPELFLNVLGSLFCLKVKDFACIGDTLRIFHEVLIASIPRL